MNQIEQMFDRLFRVYGNKTDQSIADLMLSYDGLRAIKYGIIRERTQFILSDASSKIDAEILNLEYSMAPTIQEENKLTMLKEEQLWLQQFWTLLNYTEHFPNNW